MPKTTLRIIHIEVVQDSEGLCGRSMNLSTPKSLPGQMSSSGLRNAKNPVEVLPVNGADRESALLALQVTTRSPMGAIVYETGGLLIDHGLGVVRR